MTERDPNRPAPPGASALSIQIQEAASLSGKTGRRPPWPASGLYNSLPVASQLSLELPAGGSKSGATYSQPVLPDRELICDRLSTGHYSGNAVCSNWTVSSLVAAIPSGQSDYSLQRISCALACFSRWTVRDSIQRFSSVTASRPVDSRGSCSAAPSWRLIPVVRRYRNGLHTAL